METKLFSKESKFWTGGNPSGSSIDTTMFYPLNRKQLLNSSTPSRANTETITNRSTKKFIISFIVYPIFTIILWKEFQFLANLNTLSNRKPLKMVRDISSPLETSFPFELLSLAVSASSVNEMITIDASNQFMPSIRQHRRPRPSILMNISATKINVQMLFVNSNQLQNSDSIGYRSSESVNVFIAMQRMMNAQKQELLQMRLNTLFTVVSLYLILQLTIVSESQFSNRFLILNLCVYFLSAVSKAELIDPAAKFVYFFFNVFYFFNPNILLPPSKY